MREELNLRKGPQQQLFVDYLNAGLRSASTTYSATARFRPDGGFEPVVTAPFKIGDEVVALVWTLHFDGDGELLHVNVDAPDGAPEQSWARHVSDLVTSALARALDGRRTDFFMRRFAFYVGPRLDGEYWLNARFRVAPAGPHDEPPVAMNVERVICFDYVVQGVDPDDAKVIAIETASRWAARLSLLLNIGLYSGTATDVWVYDAGEGRTGSVRRPRGYAPTEQAPTQMPKKGELCPPGKYAGTLDPMRLLAPLSLPPECRKILRAVDQGPPNLAEAFDGCARLWQVALVVSQHFPSVGMAYQVAAVEAASAADPATRGFGPFVRRYVAAKRDLDFYIDHFYGAARSAHFHAGQFPAGEFARFGLFGPVMDRDHIERQHLQYTCHDLTREAIANWLRELLPDGAVEHGADE